MLFYLNVAKYVAPPSKSMSEKINVFIFFDLLKIFQMKNRGTLTSYDMLFTHKVSNSGFL